MGFQVFCVQRSAGGLVLFFVSASAGGVSAAHFGGLRILRTLCRMAARGEPGRPEFKARRFHTPVENAIYLLGTSATRPPPGVLAGVPSGPKAAAAAGHIEAASRAQHAPLAAVDYVFIMDASERARSLASLRTLSGLRQRFHIARTTSADLPVPCDRILIGPASGNGAAVRACA